MSRTAPLALLLAVAAAFAFAAPAALTQTPEKSGYLVNSSSDLAWKDAFGHCWRAGYWTPAHAIMECDPDLLPRPAAATPPERKRAEGKAEKQPVSENRARTARN